MMRSAVGLVVILLSIFGASQRAFSRPPKNQDEALQCMLFVSAFDRNNNELGRGSAFIVEEKGGFWIYTNAHVLDGATRIEFSDFSGRKLQKFGRFACYAVGAGDVPIKDSKGKVIRYGGDGVKIELKEKRALAFELETKPISANLEVVTLGDNGGTKEMDVLEGEISMVTSKVFLTTCKTTPGSSGGALVVKDSWRVIGLNTWGLPSSVKPIDILWSSDAEIESSYAGASRLSAVSWDFMPAGNFMKGSKLLSECIETIRILSLVYLMTPTKTGFVIDPDDILAVNTTFGDAFGRYKNDQLLSPIFSLNDRLGRAKNSSISVSSMEVVKTYYKTISELRERYKEQQEEIFATLPSFHRLELERTGFYKFGERMHKELEVAEEWFGKRARIGGTIPLNAWFNLPRLSDF